MLIKVSKLRFLDIFMFGVYGFRFQNAAPGLFMQAQLLLLLKITFYWNWLLHLLVVLRG